MSAIAGLLSRPKYITEEKRDVLLKRFEERARADGSTNTSSDETGDSETPRRLCLDRIHSVKGLGEYTMRSQSTSKCGRCLQLNYPT